MDLFSALMRLFRLLPPETAHRLALAALQAGLVPGDAAPDDPHLRVEACGLRFSNPIGLAAGFDKNAEAWRQAARLGFGFVEVGSVTPKPQPGNPKPRLFRLPADRAIINRMGFNNDGAAATAQRLAALDRTGQLHRVPLGINIGKSKITPVEDATGDYVASLDRLWPYADYVVVNVSSPNTPGLRDLQESSALAGILGALIDLNRMKADITRRRPRPILVKVADEYRDKGVVFCALNQDEDADTIRKFLEEQKLAFPIGLDADHEPLRRRRARQKQQCEAEPRDEARTKRWVHGCVGNRTDFGVGPART